MPGNWRGRVLEAWKAAGVGMSTHDEGLPQTLEGKSVVVTGTLEHFSRESAKEAIERRGRQGLRIGEQEDGLGGRRSQSRFEATKAEELGIPIIDEQQFDTLLATGDVQ